MHGDVQELYSPTGIQTGHVETKYGTAIEQRSGFLLLVDITIGSLVSALDAEGNQTPPLLLDGVGGIVATNPRGGMVLASPHYFNESSDWLWAFDSQGKKRWSSGSDELGEPIALGVDRQGNTLVLLGNGAYPISPTAKGIWFTKDGVAGPAFPIYLGTGEAFELVPQVGSGLFLRRIEKPTIHSNAPSIWIAAFPALTTTPQAPPEWLASRPNTQLHMVHNGTGYALLPVPHQSADCSDKVEVLAADGTSCGTVTFKLAPGACMTQSIRVGYDGTVIQQLPSSMEQCTPMGNCTCTYQWWPAYFH